MTFGFRHFSLNAGGTSDMSFALYGLGPSTGDHNNQESDTLYKLNLAYAEIKSDLVCNAFRRI